MGDKGLLQKLPPRHKNISFKDEIEKTKELFGLIHSNNVLVDIEEIMTNSNIGNHYLEKAITSTIIGKNTYLNPYCEAIYLMLQDIAIYSMDDMSTSDKIFRLENDNKMLKEENKSLREKYDKLKTTVNKIYDMIKGD